MIKRLIFASVLAACAWSAPAMAQTHTAAELAEGLQPMVGTDYGHGIKLIGIKAEANNTLVLIVDAAEGWGAVDRDKTTEIFMTGFCTDPDGVEFVKTGWVRVDTLDHGKDPRSGGTSNTCPAAQ